MNAPESQRSNAWIWITVLAIGLVLGCGAAAVGIALFAGMYTVRSTQGRVLEAERVVYAEEQARREAEQRMEAERAEAEAARREAEEEAERARAELERALAESAGLGDGTTPSGDRPGMAVSELEDAPVPRVSTGSSEVRGSLPAEVIRRVVRRHINEVRFCYEQGLQRNPALAGRVTVSFVISPAGDVQSSTVASTTLGDASVEGCIVRAVRRWNFPAPEGGGIVLVDYPFDFTAAN